MCRFFETQPPQTRTTSLVENEKGMKKRRYFWGRRSLEGGSRKNQFRNGGSFQYFPFLSQIVAKSSKLATQSGKARSHRFKSQPLKWQWKVSWRGGVVPDWGGNRENVPIRPKTRASFPDLHRVIMSAHDLGPTPILSLKSQIARLFVVDWIRVITRENWTRNGQLLSQFVALVVVRNVNDGSPEMKVKWWMRGSVKNGLTLRAESHSPSTEWGNWSRYLKPNIYRCLHFGKDNNDILKEWEPLKVKVTWHFSRWLCFCGGNTVMPKHKATLFSYHSES